MATNFFYRKAKDCRQMPDACLRYHITLPRAGGIDIDDINACDGTLSLIPGSVTDDSGLSCRCQESELILPACVSDAVERCSVPVEPPCQTICDALGEDAEQNDRKRRCPSCCIWTSTTKEANAAAVCAGDTVTYTITFTNHSAVALDMVVISDHVPAGVTVAPDSIHPAPQRGETLESGISMGSLPAGQSVALIYTVTVNFDAPCQIRNCACARYYYTDCRGCLRSGRGSCKRCVITLQNRCLCQCVCRCFSLCGFRRLRYCYIYDRGVNHYSTAFGKISTAGFGIAVNYVDTAGETRSQCFESSVLFDGLRNDRCSDCFHICFTNPVYHTDCRGNMTVQFIARLCKKSMMDI